jgi:protein involved in polysaccharide export with SLBB domain
MVAENKSAVGRQIHLPLRRAFLISVKSIKIRFWRSVITAGGIFLGIAFLVSVLAQMALQVPATPVEYAYPNAYVRGMVAKSLDKPMEPGLTAKGAIDLAGGYLPRADKATVTVIKNTGDAVTLDFSNPATADVRLAGGDVVFVPDSRGRLHQLIIVLVLVTASIIALVIAGKIPEKRKRTITSTAIAAGGIFLLYFGLAHSGLTAPKAPQVKTIQSYHVRGEVKAPSDQPAGKGMSVAQAIAGAGGFAANADRRHIIVMVRGKGKVNMDLGKGGAAGSSLILHAGDLVYIPDASARNRQLWLVVMSLIVCTIGITNSMLMSVTERFKEIGTMKCLGALDKFVVELFLLESSMLGLFASFAGWLVGFGAMALMAIAAQGWGALAQLSLVDTLKMLGLAVGSGSLLTMIATIAPAIRAAQMPPAAALRVEI